MVKEFKGASSHYVNHTLRPSEYHFAWQRGYGYFTLGESQCPRAIEYVLKQKEHHQQQTTNPWLERYTDEDDGPPDPGLTAIRNQGRVLREEPLIYRVEAELPF